MVTKVEMDVYASVAGKDSYAVEHDAPFVQALFK